MMRNCPNYTKKPWQFREELKILLVDKKKSQKKAGDGYIEERGAVKPSSLFSIICSANN